MAVEGSIYLPIIFSFGGKKEGLSVVVLAVVVVVVLETVSRLRDDPPPCPPATAAGTQAHGSSGSIWSKPEMK